MGRKESNKNITKQGHEILVHILSYSAQKPHLYAQTGYISRGASTGLMFSPFFQAHRSIAARRWICIKMSYITTQGQEVSEFLHAIDPTKATGIDGLGP